LLLDYIEHKKAKNNPITLHQLYPCSHKTSTHKCISCVRLARPSIDVNWLWFNYIVQRRAEKPNKTS